MVKQIEKIQPRGFYILVEPEESKNKEVNGLMLPENEKEDQKAMGIVLAVGSNVEDIKKGDRVVYGVFTGEEIVMKEGIKEKEYKMLHDEDIIAFIK